LVGVVHNAQHAQGASTRVHGVGGVGETKVGESPNLDLSDCLMHDEEDEEKK
jgi:hypothetical protein